VLPFCWNVTDLFSCGFNVNGSKMKFSDQPTTTNSSHDKISFWGRVFASGVCIKRLVPRSACVFALGERRG